MDMQLTRLDEGRLEHVGEQGQDGVQGREVLLLTDLAVLDAREELAQDSQIQDQGSSEEGVLKKKSAKENDEGRMQTDLALVEDVDGRAAAAEDLGVVLVDRALRVAHGGDVLDHDDVVGVLALADGDALRADSGRLVEQAVRVDHVVDDAALADLLAPELALGGQVVPVVVAEMVVGRDGERLDARVDEELGEDGLELGLPGLEVVAADERLLALREGDDTGDEGVLGGTVNEGLALEDGGDGEDAGRRHLRVGRLDRGEEVVGGVVDAGDQVGVALGVGSPEYDDTVEAVVLLELADIRADVVQVRLLVVAGNQVVGAGLLVRSNEVGVVDGWEGLAQKCHVGEDLALKVVVEHLSALHGLVHGDTRNVPTTENEVVGVDHGENI